MYTQLGSMPNRTRSQIFAFTAILYLILMANWWLCWVRFSSPRLNYVFMAVVFSSPLALLWIARGLNRSTFRSLALVVAVPLSVLSSVLLLGLVLVMAFWVPDVVVRDVDYSFERLRQERVGNEFFGVFRTNGGAATSFGIVVQKEAVIVPGLLKVQRVCSYYPAYDVRVTRVDARIIRCEFPPYGVKRTTVEVVDTAG